MKRHRKALLLAGTPLLVYVLVYIANSSCGGYWWPFEHRDGFEWHSPYFLTPLPHTILWQPRYGHLAYHHSDALGLLFFPLIRLDQALAHPTIDILRDDGDRRFTALSPSGFHPDCRKEFLELKTKAANKQLQQTPTRQGAAERR